MILEEDSVRLTVRMICILLAVALAVSMAAVPSFATEMDEDLEDIMNSSSSSMGYIDSEEEAAAAASREEETEPTAAETAPPEETESDEEPTEEAEETAASETEEVFAEEESEELAANKRVYNEIPLILQTDYPDIPYSDGSLATSGCTMACVAMVGSYLREEEVSPVDLARRFGKYEASNMQRMEYAAIVLDLDFEMTMSWKKVMKGLKAGKPVIIMVGKASGFTASQHMVVLTGITEDGLITVNDPYGPNYTKWELADGFENGFEEVDVKTGFAGAWIFEEYEEPPVVPTRYPGVELTTEEEYLLASIIWLESRGESFEGQQAIAEIVLNRLIAEGFPNTIHDVIFAENQFTTTAFLDDAKPGEIQYKAIKTALTGESVLPVDVYYFGRYPKNDRIWGTIGGHTFCYRG